jgi:hypothetical protein
MPSLGVSPTSLILNPTAAVRRARFLRLLLLVLSSLLLAACGGRESLSPPTPMPSDSWSVDTSSPVWTISYGSGISFPQYGALDTGSGYLRLIPNAQSGWGTSVVIIPSFWSGGAYHQGSPLVVSHQVTGSNLVLDFTGDLAGLSIQGRLTISPPNQGIMAQVDILSVTGNVILDSRPGEAFKLMMLSSMHISDTQWDSQSAFVGSQTYTLPASGWIIDPPQTGTVFGLTGGTSSWKTNAPTMELTFPTSQTVTGWVTNSNDPNDDNVGLWASSDSVVSSYTYNITARP